MGRPRCLLCKHLGCSRAGREAATEKTPTSAGNRLGRTGRLRASPGCVRVPSDTFTRRKGPHPAGRVLRSSGAVVLPGLPWFQQDLPERFRFCGDLDCPDWVLAEISTLAKISSVKLRLLCSQVLKELLGQGIDYEKVLKLTADARFESGDVKAMVAVLSFILSSAAKHSVDGESLSSELQQLGLPKEHAACLCRCYEEKQSSLQEHLRACSLRVNRLAGAGWRVDYILRSSLLQSVEEPMVRLRLEVAVAPDAPAQVVALSLSADKFQVLLAELKQAQTLMSSLG
ncbi:COMM domain-containing protein 4 isoform X1 [Artibeus jamaicensis]|uniref:COMM domain-containing protein 4 isoform X1 n=1 Tax=Artibeus jamaicensis TaxID=9417 RepID=UPI00235AB2B7|nr:COMM domain-containing protein 4 isoform X1 [Artibeus jamaicensis]